MTTRSYWWACLGVWVQKGCVDDVHVDELQGLQVIVQGMAHKQPLCRDHVQDAAANILQASGHRR